ncbi:MAG: hypothetical protein GXY36_19630 [Chloroflexi bacterium]|jgi:CO/xanthine dehydrogenase FAD-binding subunit|nr:hypothetical protein [Chloroflexota bacterium]
MLLNLKTIHKPATVEEAAGLLADPGVYPLYGGAALHRANRTDVEAALDLGQLGLDFVRDSENSLRLGSMLSLEAARQACLERRDTHPQLGAVADTLAADLPLTLRNTMTLGDLLVERDPQSLTLTLLLVLGAVIKRVDVDMHFTMAAWLTTDSDVARYLIAGIQIPNGPEEAVIAFEKVARTPADAPIVGAVGCRERSNEGVPYTTLALCGVAPAPVPQPELARVLDETGDLDVALERLEVDPVGDHWGSREYRIEMARVLARRVLARLME